ncbi:MAG: GatB/YqeY domain-containing protein [Anaerolineae bacterium]|nr:GatB/YqeY domain-containing protein [Anaerolineae bacterium]
MNLKDQLNEELKEAMRGGDKLKAQTIRSLKSAIKYAEIEAGQTLEGEALLAVIVKQAKQRRDAITEFEKAGRDDLVQNEAAELAILEKYLPAQLSEAEIEAKIKAIITELGVTDQKGMGQVMSRAMAELKGQADGKVVNQVTRKLLSS